MSEVLVNERLLSPTDLAAYLGVPLQTVYAWRCRGGGPPGYRIGKHVRFRQAEVDEWLVSRADDVLAAGGLSR